MARGDDRELPVDVLGAMEVDVHTGANRPVQGDVVKGVDEAPPQGGAEPVLVGGQELELPSTATGQRDGGAAHARERPGCIEGAACHLVDADAGAESRGHRADDADIGTRGGLPVHDAQGTPSLRDPQDEPEGSRDAPPSASGVTAVRRYRGRMLLVAQAVLQVHERRFGGRFFGLGHARLWVLLAVLILVLVAVWVSNRNRP